MKKMFHTLFILVVFLLWVPINRAHVPYHSAYTRLKAIMELKQSNLCVAADVRTKVELLSLIDVIGNDICILKTHIDIIQDFDEDLIVQLKERAQRYNFLIFEDRKFADIGSVVKEQLIGGIYHIADWADIITVHSIAGSGTLQALTEIHNAVPGVLLIAQMSSENALTHDDYTAHTVAIAREYPNVVIGLIAQERLDGADELLLCTPGIHSTHRGDGSGQQYQTPEEATLKGSDILIVGRGITAAHDKKQAIQEYRRRGWQAYGSK